MSTASGTSPLISGGTKKRVAADFRVYLNLKIAIHREILKHINLKEIDPEKVTAQNHEHAESQVYAVIQELMAIGKTPLSAPEKDQLSLEILGEVFRLGLLEPLLQDPGTGGGDATSEIAIKSKRLFANSYSIPNSFASAFHLPSTSARVLASIVISSGQGRVKPSVDHLRVASIPIFEP